MNGSRPSADDRDIVELLTVATLEPTDAFRATLRAELDKGRPDDVAVVRTTDERRRRAVPLVLVAAAAVVAVVAAAVVLRSPSDELDPAALTGSALFDELDGRTWYALERFDDPSPSSLTSVVTFSGTADAPEMTAHDGCTAYGGAFTLDGRTIVGDDIAVPGSDCGVDVLAIEPGHQIELRPDDVSFTLLDESGNPVASFVDGDSLAPATADVMPFTWFVDDLETVSFNDTGRGVATLCTLLAWEERDGRILVTLPDPDAHSCGGFEDEDGVIEFSPVGRRLRELTLGGTEVRRVSDGLLLVGDDSAIQLRTIPTAIVDPTGVTIAAGALFGIEPGLGVTPDELVAAAEPVLGAPDVDSGWLDGRDLGDIGSFITCGLDDYREIVWGDLVSGFWGSGSRTVLAFWYVGDRRILSSSLPDAQHPAQAGRSGLATEHGVSIGDPSDEIPDRPNMTRIDRSAGDPRFDGSTDVVRTDVISTNPRATRANLETPILGGSYLTIDGTVAAFGSEAIDC